MYSTNLPLHCTFCLCCSSCNCCHDPFIVRSTRTCPPFTGFTQFARPSRCSRSTLTTVCVCALLFSRDHVMVSVFRSGLCVPIGSLCSRRVSSPVRSITGSSPSSCSGVGSMVSRIPILQICNVVVVLKQILASFQHLRSSSLQAPS